MKLLLLLSVLFAFAAAFGQPSKEEIKKYRIKKTVEKKIEGTDSTERIWWYDRQGYDSVQGYYGSTVAIKNSFKNGKLVQKTFLTADGKPGDTYIYVYNPDGSYKETYTDGSFGMKSYTWYDKKGNILKSQSPDGNTTTYTYDAKGRLLKIKSDGKNEGVKVDHKFFYNAKGQLVKAERNTDGNRSVATYEYDAKGKLIKQVQKNFWEGQEAQTVSLSEYNEKGLLKKIVMTTIAASEAYDNATVIFEYAYEYY